MKMYVFLVSLTIFLFDFLVCDGINTESIRLATEYQVKRSRDYIENNYENIINSGENYVGCEIYDMCSSDPPTLWNDDSTIIDPWYTSGTAWHSPLCNASETLIGVRPNNHNEDTGELLTDSTCPEYDEYIGCNYDNSLLKSGIKIPDGTDETSQYFLDATCFTYELEDIWTTRQYSNCNTNDECYELYYELNNIINGTIDDINELELNNISCNTNIGICTNTPSIDIGTFEPQYVEYQYFGDQRTGILAQLPTLYWDALDTNSCPGSYDPRFRPWYAATAAGPKDLIIILDTSGSMAYTTDSGSTRLSVMKEAAIAVLDTLISDDYATVIEFATNADSYSSSLLSITDENRCELENYIDDLSAAGSTNYEAAFELAYEIMSNSMSSNAVSGCNAQVILFLTDGEITSGTTEIVQYIETLKSDVSNEGIDFSIITYGIGDDLDASDLSTLKNISCNNEGIYYEIKDIDDSLSTTMASYYQLFVSLRDITNDNDTHVVWIDYLDALTGYRLISANLPVYDKTTDPYTLLGVVVADVAAERLINSTASDWGNDVGIYSDFEEIFEDMLNTAKICPTLNYDFDQLETIRASINENATCSSSTGNTDNDDGDSDGNGSNKDNGNLGTETIGIIIGCIVGLLFLMIIVICYMKSKKGKKAENVSEGMQGTGAPKHEGYDKPPGIPPPAFNPNAPPGAGETYANNYR